MHAPWRLQIRRCLHANATADQTENDSTLFLQRKSKKSRSKPTSNYSATRRLMLKTKLLRKAESLLDKEQDQKRIERENVLNERAPPLKLSGLSVQELQELCKDLHHKIDIVDEARYDLLLKVGRNDSEIQSLHQKIYELKGKMKRPKLKRVKKSADDMLGALTDNKLMKADFKANLKTVKKEEEKKEEVTDWRKNVEAMSGMEGRKKIFNAGQ
ncbi:troponin I4a [Astyanax mexicanus]|uniref:Troponin I, fast skeletal muscle-like n=2 Tax=Astyanax mexicanus TaxID=7994 RepID=A0A8T2M713_ASTMX|nr:troponin I4a [Astyanax mexicanus]KAG9280348.1 troponin I, fast skeletal muscle-like [Astyanax mexicanus]